MKINFSKLGLALRRYSLQASTIGGTLTATAASLSALGVPGAGKIAIVGGVLTAVAPIVAALIPQEHVDTYNPTTHDVVEKVPGRSSE